MDPLSLLSGTLAIVFRAFVAQPFTIPSGSMTPTLEVGDYIWVAKYAYGYSNFSLPLGSVLPVFTYARTLPARGDVVVFRLPSDPDVDYVMRVVGLPGETIELRRGVVLIDGKPLPHAQRGRYQGSDPAYAGAVIREETLPEGRTYSTLDAIPDSRSDEAGPVKIPEGHVFVLGDNRDNANDSRFGVGFVPVANIVGKVVAAVQWPGGAYTSRPVR
jgi:signal peptidase I